MTGVLYLENNLTYHVFTPARIAVLKLLASQAAISLENTRLYGDIHEREGRIRRLVDSNIIGILIWNVDGRIIEANDAFLQMLAYGRNDLVSGRVRWTDLTPAEWRADDEQAVAQLAATGSVQPFEKEYARKDGRRGMRVTDDLSRSERTHVSGCVCDGIAEIASMTRVEYTSAAPAFTAIATLNASTISSSVAPCFNAASVWIVMHPSHWRVTATARAMSSRVFAPRRSFLLPASLSSR